MIYDLHPHTAWERSGPAVRSLVGHADDLSSAAHACCCCIILHYGEREEK